MELITGEGGRDERIVMSVSFPFARKGEKRARRMFPSKSDYGCVRRRLQTGSLHALSQVCPSCATASQQMFGKARSPFCSKSNPSDHEIRRLYHCAVVFYLGFLSLKLCVGFFPGVLSGVSFNRRRSGGSKSGKGLGPRTCTRHFEFQKLGARRRVSNLPVKAVLPWRGSKRRPHVHQLGTV